jgi:hypothetical protein
MIPTGWSPELYLRYESPPVTKLHELGLEHRFSHSLPFIRVWLLPAAARAFLLGLGEYGHSPERYPPVQAFWKRKQLPAEYSLESVVPLGLLKVYNGGLLGQPKRRLVSPRLPPPQRRGTTEAA